MSFIMRPGSHEQEPVPRSVGTPGVLFSDQVSKQNFQRIKASSDARLGPTQLEAGTAPELHTPEIRTDFSELEKVMRGRSGDTPPSIKR